MTVPFSGESSRIGCPAKLILIRHATTDMTGTFCGQSDPSLNMAGRAEARKLAALLKDFNVRRLYASDLRRAVETAEPLAELWGIPIGTRAALREISFGEWEGKRWSQICADQPDIRAMESSPDLCAPAGETFSSFRRRVLRALREIIMECNGYSAAVVTHLGVLRVLLKELSTADCPWDPQQRIDPCAFYEVQAPYGTITSAVPRIGSAGM